MKGEHRYLWKENYQKQFKNVRMIGILYNLLTAKLYNYFIKIDCLIRFYGEIHWAEDRDASPQHIAHI